MQILLTNDDGISAKGILTLCEYLKDLAQVYVVAPDRERSATGHGITLRDPIPVREVKLSCTALPCFAVGGTPADCVKLAVQGNLIPKPDLVISGINHGQNLGTDVLYSGTVSAAIEAALLGIPGMAVSLASYQYQEFAYAAEVAAKISLYLAKKGLTPDTLLNVNVPPVEKSEIIGLRITRLGHVKYRNVFREANDAAEGERLFYQGGEIIHEESTDPEIDINAIRNKEVSITPIHFDLTNYRIMNIIQNWHIQI